MLVLLLGMLEVLVLMVVSLRMEKGLELDFEGLELLPPSFTRLVFPSFVLLALPFWVKHRSRFSDFSTCGLSSEGGLVMLVRGCDLWLSCCT